MGNLEKKLVKSEITNIINDIPEIEQAFIFGSYATNTEDSDSDIDVLVILKKRGISQTYMERVTNQLFISRKIKGLYKKKPIDLLVYTHDEWELILSEGENDFIKTVREQGIVLK